MLNRHKLPAGPPHPQIKLFTCIPLVLTSVLVPGTISDVTCRLFVDQEQVRAGVCMFVGCSRT